MTHVRFATNPVVNFYRYHLGTVKMQANLARVTLNQAVLSKLMASNHLEVRIAVAENPITRREDVASLLGSIPKQAITWEHTYETSEITHIGKDLFWVSGTDTVIDLALIGRCRAILERRQSEKEKILERIKELNPVLHELLIKPPKN